MKRKITPPAQLMLKRKVTRLRGVRSPKHARHDHIGKLFLLGSRVFEHFALEEWRALGVVDLRLAHLALIRALPAEGRRTTEIAELAGMTKQAVGQLAMELEKMGYVVRLPDPTDGRAKLVRYAPRGHELLKIIPQVIHRSEARIEAAIGLSDFIVVRRALKRLLEKVGDDTEEFL